MLDAESANMSKQQISLSLEDLDLKGALDTLSGLEVLILYSRFVTRMTLEQLAALLCAENGCCGNYDTESRICPKLADFPSITKERVRQLEIKALLRLKRYLCVKNGNVVMPYLISRRERLF